MPYFHLSHGLRGAYVDDSNRVLHAKTRRELKEAIKYEADSYADAGYVGASKKAVAAFAVIAWREAKKPKPAYLPYCLPLARERGADYAFGIFVSVASRKEYREYLKEME